MTSGRLIDDRSLTHSIRVFPRTMTLVEGRWESFSPLIVLIRSSFFNPSHPSLINICHNLFKNKGTHKMHILQRSIRYLIDVKCISEYSVSSEQSITAPQMFSSSQGAEHLWIFHITAKKATWRRQCLSLKLLNSKTYQSNIQSVH